MTEAQFEISIDGVPRTYRDRKDLALQSAQLLKSRNPNSVVRLKDLKTEKRSPSRSRRRNNNGMPTLPIGPLAGLAQSESGSSAGGLPRGRRELGPTITAGPYRASNFASV